MNFVTAKHLSLETKIITRWSDFDPLAKEWNDLLQRSRSNTIFLTWEWLQTWREVTQEAAKPFVVTVRDENGRLVGAVPFYISELRLLKALPFRTLRMMADHATGSEYADWIVDPDVETAALSAIADALLAAKSDWDTIWMPRMAGWTGAMERIKAACEEKGLLHHSRTTVFSYFDLPDSMQLYEESFSSKRRQQMRRKRRKLLNTEGVEVVLCEKLEDLPQFIETLFELHYRRWQLDGQEGAFRRKPYEAEFYRQFSRIALKNDWLWLIALTDHGEIKSVQIGYVYNGVFLQLQEGFDPDYVQGSGNVLRTEVIERCIDAGISGYDFLGGGSEHKRRWGAEERDGYDLFIAHPSKLKNKLLFSKEIWPSGRYIDEIGLLGGA